MKIWVDDIRPAPQGYVWCKSVNEAKNVILHSHDAVNRMMQAGHDLFLHRDYVGRTQFYDKANECDIELIDLDHDAGDYAKDGGDYINLLSWLEMRQGISVLDNLSTVKFHLHTMNPVGRDNMRRIIEKNHWQEVY